MTDTEAGTPTGRDAGPAPGVLEAALSWLRAHAEWFGPRWDEHFPPRDFDGATVMELLMLCRLLRRTAPSAPGGPGLERAAAEVARNTVAGAGRDQGTENLPYRLWTLALLDDLGHPADEPFAAASALAERHPPRPPGGGASPVHALELRHILDLARLPVPADLPGPGPLYEACVAEHADGTGEYDAYGITHTVLYATDFGDRPPPGDTARLGRVLDDLLRAYLSRGHLDLVAELVLCSRIVHGAPSELERRAWERLAGAQRPDGSLPGPPFDAAVLAERTGEKATAYVFRTCYHTTLVTAMAAAHAGAAARA